MANGHILLPSPTHSLLIANSKIWDSKLNNCKYKWRIECQCDLFSAVTYCRHCLLAVPQLRMTQSGQPTPTTDHCLLGLICIHWLSIAMKELRSKFRTVGLTKISKIWLIVLLMASKVFGEYYHVANCSSLLPGQYLCNELNIDPKNQQLKGCTKEGHTRIPCTSAPGIICRETNNGTFEREVPCRYTNGYSYETALLLSVFLGMFGIDRVYLGYYAVGLAKFCTLGFLFLGQLIDIILIATQTIGPADGSHYVISYFGAGITVIRMDNTTYRMPQEDWVLGQGSKEL